MPTDESLSQLEPASRMAILLDAADAASRLKLDRHPETLDACMNALNLCRTWMAGGAVAPDELAHFVDVEVGEKSCLQESWFQEDAEGCDAFIFVTMVVAHVAHFAYVAAGQETRMSESISEAGWNLIDTLVEYGRNEGLLSCRLQRRES